MQETARTTLDSIKMQALRRLCRNDINAIVQWQMREIGLSRLWLYMKICNFVATGHQMVHATWKLSLSMFMLHFELKMYHSLWLNFSIVECMMHNFQIKTKKMCNDSWTQQQKHEEIIKETRSIQTKSTHHKMECNAIRFVCLRCYVCWPKCEPQINSPNNWTVCKPLMIDF